MKPRRSARQRLFRIVLLLSALGVGGCITKRAYDRVRPLPPPTAGDASRGEWAFMESDLGSKDYASVPRAIWDALPVLYPDLFVEGWAGLGFLSRPDDPDGPPVGMVRTTVLGVETYASNCAICHAARIDGKIVAGAPNGDLDVQRITYTIMTALKREDLTVDAVARVSEAKGRPLGFRDRQAVRLWLGLAQRKASTRSLAWFKGELGPGRSDALNGWKRILGAPEGEHRSWVDIPAIYNQRLKKKMLLDGSVSGDPAVRVTMTELEKGRPARDPLLHREVFDDIVAYLNERIAPPRFPYPVDQDRAERGRALFGETCASCHGTYGPGERTYPNKRIGVDRVGTDSERALAMTADITKPLVAYGYDALLSVDPQPTYTPPPLDGVWATAPYFHNGSVPTLWHLLSEEAERPVLFWRGRNELDPIRVGIVCAEERGRGERLPGDPLACGKDGSQQKHDERVLFLFDARRPGNRNTGHRFGTTLPEGDKLALLEYLKTI